jgi:hypothetical protein
LSALFLLTKTYYYTSHELLHSYTPRHDELSCDLQLLGPLAYH